MVFSFRKYKILKRYNQYRAVGKELNNKILDRFLDRTVFLKSGKLLGLVKKDIFIIDRELEQYALMDFAINEYRTDGINAVELYKEKVTIDNPIENNILEALIQSYTSLFKIVDVRRKENTIVLGDIFNNFREPIALYDKGFSQTAYVGQLIFIRVVTLEEFNIGSGFAFVFPGELQDYLLKQYKFMLSQVKSSSESIRKFIAFFKLYRQHGSEISFQ